LADRAVNIPFLQFGGDRRNERLTASGPVDDQLLVRVARFEARRFTPGTFAQLRRRGRKHPGLKQQCEADQHQHRGQCPGGERFGTRPMRREDIESRRAVGSGEHGSRWAPGQGRHDQIPRQIHQ